MIVRFSETRYASTCCYLIALTTQCNMRHGMVSAVPRPLILNRDPLFSIGASQERIRDGYSKKAEEAGSE